MTTIGHVRACVPETMVSLAEVLATQTNTFTDRVGQMARDVDHELGDWKGAGAAAASARTLAHQLDANHLAETVVGLADHYNAFGTELSGYRDVLLTTVVHATEDDGMSVDDAGNVTAPKVPPGNEHPSVPGLVQHYLDTQAAGYQSKIQHLLAQFGDAEARAAKAITDSLQLLDTYEKHPSPDVGSKVKDILAGKARLPDDPQQLHDFWATLTPAEKDALWKHDPYIGNRDGIPVVDRDHYNRMTLQDELARARAGDPALQGKRDDLEKISKELQHPDRYLMLLDTKSGATTHAAIASGNPDLADHVATFVPGTGSRPSKSMYMDWVDRMRDQAGVAGAKNPAVISWLGYDAPPELLDATHRRYADAGADALNRFQNGLRASHVGAPSYNTVVGHSYGTTLVGDAASHGRTLNADAVVFVASPGTTVEHASDLSLTGVRPEEVGSRVYATAAVHDPTPLYAAHRVGKLDDVIGGVSSGPDIYDPYNPTAPPPKAAGGLDDYGMDPTDPDFRGRTFPSDPGPTSELGLNGAAHNQYWEPGNRSLEGMGHIIAGKGDKATQIPPAPPPVAQTQPVPTPPPPGNR
ncbi:alpha/beta hydrolase [Nocardia sp. NPDC006044]|uniref:alpha/beta hydrolase n=1 Tax=Nocardia sp. NPDC006044 TaxID=3364306 RepID=UPI0036C31938